MELEKSVERKSVLFAIQLGWLAVKIEKADKPGHPDRMFLKYGVVLFVEFKRWGAKPRKTQLARHEEYAKAGHTVHVVDHFDIFRDIILKAEETYGPTSTLRAPLAEDEST